MTRETRPSPQFPADALVAAVASRTGSDHVRNEDAWWMPDGETPTPHQKLEKGTLYIVADGVGGHAAGEIASRMAVEEIARAYYRDSSEEVSVALRRALQAANEAVYRQAQGSDRQGMAATVVAAVVRGQELVIAHAGDSRAYLLRQGRLHRLTTDHTWVAERVAEGVLTPQEAAVHPQRHLITRALGNRPTLEPEVQPYVFLPGDRLLLCTDGVWELVDEGKLRRTLRKGTAEQVVGALIEQVEVLQGADDATALVVETRPPEEHRGEKVRPRSPRPALLLAVGLLTGLLIGWWVLGWWLFPVRWTDAAPADLHPDYRVLYLDLLARAYAADPGLDVRTYVRERWPPAQLQADLERAYRQADPMQRRRLERLAAALRVRLSGRSRAGPDR